MAGGGDDHVVLAVDDGDPGGVELVEGAGGQRGQDAVGDPLFQEAAAVS